MSVDQYDEIGVAYEGFKSLPMIKYSELPSFMGMLGDDVAGRSVLDLACGTGLYTRRIKALGAADVVGVDISPAMIDAAEQSRNATRQESATRPPTPPNYALEDAPFDRSRPAYLLNYADSEDRHEAHVRRSPWRPRTPAANPRPHPEPRATASTSPSTGNTASARISGTDRCGPRARITALLDPRRHHRRPLPRRDVYEAP